MNDRRETEFQQRMSLRDAASRDLEDRQNRQGAAPSDDDSPFNVRRSKRKLKAWRVVVHESQRDHRAFLKRSASGDDVDYTDDHAPPIETSDFDRVQLAIHRALDEHGDIRRHVDSDELGFWLVAFAVPPALQILKNARSRAYADSNSNITVTLATAVPVSPNDEHTPLLRCVGDTQGYRVPLSYLCSVSFRRDVHTVVNEIPTCFSKVLQLFATWLMHHSSTSRALEISFDTERNKSGIARLTPWDHQFVAAVRAASAQQRRQRIFQLACLSNFMGIRPLTALACALLAEMGIDQIADWRVQGSPFVRQPHLEDTYHDFVDRHGSELSPNVMLVVRNASSDSVIDALPSDGNRVLVEVDGEGSVVLFSTAWPETCMSLAAAGLSVQFPTMTPQRLAQSSTNGLFRAHGLNEMSLPGDRPRDKVYFAVTAPLLPLLRRWAGAFESMLISDIIVDDEADDGSSDTQTSSIHIHLVCIPKSIAARCKRLAAVMLASPFKVVGGGESSPFALAISVSLPTEACSFDQSEELVTRVLHSAGLLEEVVVVTVNRDDRSTELYRAGGMTVTDHGLNVLKVRTRAGSPCLVFEAADALLQIHPRVAVMLQTALVDALDLGPDEEGRYAWPLGKANGFPESWFVVRKNVLQRPGHHTLDMDVLNCTGDFCLVRFNTALAQDVFFWEAKAAVVQEFSPVMGGKLEKLTPRVTSRVCDIEQAMAWSADQPTVCIRSREASAVAFRFDMSPPSGNLQLVATFEDGRQACLVQDVTAAWAIVKSEWSNGSPWPSPVCEITESVAAAWFEESAVEDSDALETFRSGSSRDEVQATWSDYGSDGCLPLHSLFSRGMNRSLLLLHVLLDVKLTQERLPDEPRLGLQHQQSASGRTLYRFHTFSGGSLDSRCTAFALGGLQRVLGASTRETSSAVPSSVALLLAEAGLPTAARKWLCRATSHGEEAGFFSIAELGLRVALDALDAKPSDDCHVLVSCAAPTVTKGKPMARIGATVQLPDAKGTKCFVAWERPGDLESIVEVMLYPWQYRLILSPIAP